MTRAYEARRFIDLASLVLCALGLQLSGAAAQSPLAATPAAARLRVYSLRAAATKFGEDMEVEPEGWVPAPKRVKLDRNMFAARVVVRLGRVVGLGGPGQAGAFQHGGGFRCQTDGSGDGHHHGHPVGHGFS